MDTLLQDIRHAIRAIRRRPGWALIAIFTLAFGIGANTAVFTLINGVLFRPPPVADPHELVWVSSVNGGRPSQTMSYPDYLEYKQRVGAFAGTVAWSYNSLSLGGSTPQRVEGLVVTSNYFDVLGRKPALGRGFVSNEETEPGAHPVTVLGHDLWKRRFDSDPGILDSSIIVNGRAFQVVGVAPAGFGGVELGEPTDLFVPMGMLAAAMPGNGSLLTERNAGWLRVVARLNGDQSKAQAEAEIVASTLHTDRPADDRYGVALYAMTGQLDPANRGQAAPILGLLSLVPLLVLAVACANVASLLLAQGLARRRELALRRALGATRGRLVLQMLTESLFLSIVAGAAGVVLASWLLELIVRLGSVPAEISLVLVPDGRVLALTTVLAVVTGVVFGLLPALASTKPALTPALKDDSGGATPGRARHRLRDSFVVAQVTVSLVLLITAGLFLRSLGKALTVDPGFDGSHVAAVQFDLQLQGYTRDQARAFRERLTERALGVPGAQSAAIASLIPMGGRNYGTSVESADPGVDRQDRVGVNINDVSPAYFETMGISVLRGRDFTMRDDAGAPPVVIVNETLARQMWPGADPIGKRLRLSERDESPREVIGVVRDGKYRNLVDAPRAFLFLPMRQRAGEGDVSLVVRVAGDPAPTVQALVRILAELDRNLTIRTAATMREIMARGAEVQRAASAMLGVFGALALALAALGIYGVTAHSVTQRTREVGIRMSLGAKGKDVLTLFVRGALRLSAVGVVIGVTVSAAVSRVLSSFLFGLTATDGITFVSAAVILTAVAALASYLPARRAVKVDPMVALRSE